MVKVIFIDDQYIYKHFPLPKRLDRASLFSMITMEQATSIRDLLGDALYDDIELKVEQENLSPTEGSLFQMVQYILCLYTVRSASTFMRSAVMKTRNEEARADQYVLDALAQGIDSKIEYFKTRIIKYIKNDEVLYEMALTSGQSDLFNAEDEYTGSTVFYPKNPFDKTCE